jgi:hypothetical protein
MWTAYVIDNERIYLTKDKCFVLSAPNINNSSWMLINTEPPIVELFNIHGTIDERDSMLVKANKVIKLFKSSDAFQG